jgi:hypothetical protein
MIERVLAVIGVVFVILVLAEIFKNLTKRNGKFGTVYIKTFPDGSKSYRIQLDTEPEDLKEGDKYILTVANEALKKEELEIFNGIMEE